MEKIILFDGECNFCNHIVNFVIDRDEKNRFRFAHLDSPAGQSLLRQYGREEVNNTVVLIDGHRLYLRSTAALRICKYLGSGWPLMIGFKIVPVFLRDAVYNLISKYRHLLFKKKCRVPDQKVLSKFLEAGLQNNSNHSLKSSKHG